ncbi:MAG: hypothetical protein R3264_10105 [Anaerolineae bacterium]|nr:hypothetical protein [Anaerolineae bacterium]
MKWLKAAGVGALGSLIMLILIFLGSRITSFSPFNLDPSVAFLKIWDLNHIQSLVTATHFGYGIVWSLAFVAMFGPEMNVAKGVGLALVLWLVMMAVYSPLIGWGLFGFGAKATYFPDSRSIFFVLPIKYLVGTLILHVVYGLIIGRVNPLWIRVEHDSDRPRPEISITGHVKQPH